MKRQQDHNAVTEDERRRAPRLPVRIQVEYESAEDFLIDFTANMSIGGMFIQTRSPLAVGTTFRLRFRIPGRDAPVDTMGEVCWTLRPEDAGPMHPGMGVRFDALCEADQRDVEEMLARWA